MIIHLHLFVTILQTKSANFACCNNLFIQTCIFAVHFLVSVLHVTSNSSPFGSQYDNTMSGGDVRIFLCINKISFSSCHETTFQRRKMSPTTWLN